MSETVIKFDCVSKRYRLRRGWYLSSVVDEAMRYARRAFCREATSSDHFWALRDVSFEINRGETIGLIGPNGAGKSTLLKILSRVTVPTYGTFHVKGKVGALIEIGAGFHGDLTGRENIFLNGAIMGMSRAEVEAKFDKIVAFAGVRDFIDTPIKHYSSGMEARLGFAVAAHIDPDILLVDEILAVGDAAFQATCLNRLAQLKEEDKTIVLVSHNMSNIVQQANRVLWIDHGRLRAFGAPEEVVEQYLRTAHDPRPAPGDAGITSENAPIRVLEVKVRDRQGREAELLEYGQPATIEISYRLNSAEEDPVIAVNFEDVRGYPLGGVTTRLDGVKLDTSRAHGIVCLSLTPVIFTRGTYGVTVAVYDSRLQRYLDFRPSAASFAVGGPSVASREVSGHFVYPHLWELADGQ